MFVESFIVRFRLYLDRHIIPVVDDVDQSIRGGSPMRILHILVSL